MTTPDHPFVKQPNRTLLALSIPVLFSLIAEPLTGLVDTALWLNVGRRHWQRWGRHGRPLQRLLDF
ncbi:MAG: hypothetical protein M5U34_13420 [Chloroflexi bacterium]|nr:hypothetical protein [Chloroflexota bacterium]